jgi:aryl-alcohol dehydrogenase-like predicted oxidoreductase
MQYRILGTSDLKVSEIGLGSDTFGDRVDEKTSINIINHALDSGINLIDTANIYGNGRSEDYIGKALKGKRSQAILCTKFGMVNGEGTGKDGGPLFLTVEHGGSRDYIHKAIDATLKRLNTDYIDLYQMHQPDPTTPIEETLRALDDVIRAGKVRYIGCSNFSARQLSEALWSSKVNNLTPFISIQSRYNFLDRQIESEVVPCCQSSNIGVIPWFPLAGGFLTGKYKRGEEFPPDSRFAARPDFYRRMFLSDAAFDRLDKLRVFASERGHSLTELAFAWLLGHPWLSTVIAGVTKVEQVDTNIGTTKWKLNAEEMARLNDI